MRDLLAGHVKGAGHLDSNGIRLILKHVTQGDGAGSARLECFRVGVLIVAFRRLVRVDGGVELMTVLERGHVDVEHVRVLRLVVGQLVGQHDGGLALIVVDGLD